MRIFREFNPKSITDLRVRNNMSMQDFIDFTGVRVTRSAVSFWELGTVQPNLGSITRIANAFQLPIDYFFSVSVSSNDNTETSLTAA